MRELVVGLQAKADVCGALVVSFELSDLQYDSSIAAGSECRLRDLRPQCRCASRETFGLVCTQLQTSLCLPQCWCASRRRPSSMLAASLSTAVLRSRCLRWRASTSVVLSSTRVTASSSRRTSCASSRARARCSPSFRWTSEHWLNARLNSKYRHGTEVLKYQLMYLRLGITCTPSRCQWPLLPDWHTLELESHHLTLAAAPAAGPSEEHGHAEGLALAGHV